MYTVGCAAPTVKNEGVVVASLNLCGCKIAIAAINTGVCNVSITFNSNRIAFYFVIITSAPCITTINIVFYNRVDDSYMITISISII